MNFVCLSDRLSVKIPNTNEKQILHAAGLGSKKIKLDMDDDEQMVLDKLTSDEMNDGQAVGFPHLRNCGGFEMMVCTSNCRNLNRLECVWDAGSIKSILGGGQSKIYLRPIQTSISTKPASDKKSKTTLKEKCKMCDQEILLSDLRVHFMLCRKEILDPEENNLDGWTNIEDASHAETSSAVVDVVSPMLQSSNIHVVTTVVQASESADEPIVVEITDEVDSTRDENHQMNESNCNSDMGINEKVTVIAKQCVENGISDNAIEILRHLQASLVLGRDWEITSPDQCPEGITNFIMVDRQNLLTTAFEEIDGLNNKLITLEVQFYNEVCCLIFHVKIHLY